MNSKSIYKVPNGKLLKISLEYNENTNYIENIKITGDFFAYPEEAIDIIEEKLKNIQIKKNTLFDIIKSIINKHEIEFIGLNTEGLTEGILMCLK
jgi:hypothetical protein